MVATCSCLCLSSNITTTNTSITHQYQQIHLFQRNEAPLVLLALGSFLLSFAEFKLETGRTGILCKKWKCQEECVPMPRKISHFLKIPGKMYHYFGTLLGELFSPVSASKPFFLGFMTMRWKFINNKQQN